MTQSIDPQRLRTYRERRGWTLATLAKESKVSKATLYRLEEVKSLAPTQARSLGTRMETLNKLAKALRVERGILTGELPMPQTATKHTAEPPTERSQLNVKTSDAVRNAFSLVSLRYGISVARIAEIAPVLFVIAAEASLRRRENLLEAFEERRKAMEEFSVKFPHLPECFALARNDVESAVSAEEDSINQRDILARKLPGEIFEYLGGESPDYDLRTDNPFVAYLSEALGEQAKDEYSDVKRFAADGVDYSVCRDVARELADNDADLAARILAGKVLLHEMQEQIAEYKAKRQDASWLKDKLRANAADPANDAERVRIEALRSDLHRDQEHEEEMYREFEALMRIERPEPSREPDQSTEAPQ